MPKASKSRTGNTNQERTLLGWDDGKIYFMDESGTERCVNEYPHLFVQLVMVCNNYFERQKISPRKKSVKMPKRKSLRAGSLYS